MIRQVALVLCIAGSLFAQPNDSSSKTEKNGADDTKTASAFKHDDKSRADADAADQSSKRWYTSSEWWLVIIAALTGFAIAYQAREMTRATKVMEDQRRLTDKQIEYVVNTERAWIIVTLGWWEKSELHIVETKTFTPEKGTVDSTEVSLKLTCTNQGKTPAWIYKVYGQLEICASPIQEITPNGPICVNSPIGPLGAGATKEWTVVLNCPGRRKEGDFLSACVTVEYRDIFGKERETTVGYAVNGGVNRQDALPERQRNT